MSGPTLRRPGRLWLLEDPASKVGEAFADFAVREVFIGPDPSPVRRVVLAPLEAPGPEGGSSFPLRAGRRRLRALLAAALPLARRLSVDKSAGQDIFGAVHGEAQDPSHPSAHQLRRYFDEDPGTPPVMVNLLKYADRTAYETYGRVAIRHVMSLGGELLWTAGVGPDEAGERPWDSLAILRYPSRAAFGEMLGRAHYQAASAHRVKGLAATQLLVCD